VITCINDSIECEVPSHGAGQYQLAEDAIYDLGDGRTMTIYAGFEFDGASIPRMFWWLIGSPMSQQFWAASLFHDACYRTCLLPREAADVGLYELLKQSDVGWPRRITIYRQVRLWGWAAYKQSASALACVKITNRLDRHPEGTL
jgi:hypothetical protein